MPPVTSLDVLHYMDGLSTPIILSTTNDTQYELRHFENAVANPYSDDDWTTRLDFAAKWTAARKLPLYLKKGSTYLVGPRTDTTFRNTTCAVKLTSEHNGFHLISNGGRLVCRHPQELPPMTGRVYCCFGTDDDPAEAGVINNITFEGPVFDLDSSITFTGALHLINCTFARLAGVDDAKIFDVVVRNSANIIRGAGFALWNCRRTKVRNITFEYVQQGIEMAYNQYFDIDGFYIKRYTEAFDVNQQCQDMIWTRMRGDDSDNSYDSQFMDVLGRRIQISDVRVNNLHGDIIAMYHKTASYSNYADHLNKPDGQNAAITFYSEGISISNVTGCRCGTGSGRAMLLALRRENSPQPGDGAISKAYSVSNVVLRESGPIVVNEGLGVDISKVKIYDGFGSDSSNYGVVFFGSSDGSTLDRTASILDGTLSDIGVYGCRHSGIVIERNRNISARRLHVEGYGSAPQVVDGNFPVAGIDDAALLDKGVGRHERESWTVLDTLNTGYALVRNRHSNGDYVFTSGKLIVDRGGHRFVGAGGAGGAPSGGVWFNGSNNFLMEWEPNVEVELGRFSVLNPSGSTAIAGGQKSIERTIYTAGRKGKEYWVGGRFMLGAPVVATGGSITLLLRKKRVDGTYTTLASYGTITGPLPAGTEIVPVSGLTVGNANALLAPGEGLMLVGTRDATGQGLGIDMPSISAAHFILRWRDV